MHKLLKNEPYVHVHISNLAAQTGVTRFMQVNDKWKYSKNESLTQDQLQEYTHLLVEAKSKYSLSVKAFADTHDVLDSIESFSHISLTYKVLPPIKIKTRPALFILQRKDYKEYPYGKNIPVQEIIDDDFMDENTEELKEFQAESIQPDRESHTYTTSYVNEVEADDDFVEPESDETEYGNVDEKLDVENEAINDDTVEEPKEEAIEEVIEEEFIKEEETERLEIETKLKAKKALDELKSLRRERKKKAIEKIKSETRKEVVASAKEKLRDIMKRHKHIAEELTENIPKVEDDKVDERGDIPESETIAQVVNTETEETKVVPNISHMLDNSVETEETTHSNENIDSIVEEVIARLIDRKIYDDKTKPEDIRAEDRQMIQKIVEEVLAERMNYTNTDFK